MIEWRRGMGLEIGRGEHDNCGLLNAPCKTYTADLFADHFKPDAFCDAQRLPFLPGSLDFIASAHVLEHIIDPIGALVDWYHSVRHGGYIYLNLPSKDRMFDSGRPRTELEELFYRRGSKTNFKDRPESSYSDKAALQPSAWSSEHMPHHNVWLLEDVLELIGWLRSSNRAFLTVVEHNEYANAPDRANSFEILMQARK